MGTAAYRPKLVPAILAAIFLLSSPSGVAAQEIGGQAQVLDSDIIGIDGYRVYLLGVESVERGQLCSIDGRPWQCWAAAVRALETVVGEGETVCEAITAPDVLNQVIARCRVNGEDVGARLVRAGYGLALPDEGGAYLADQAAAEAAAVGLWQGAFLPPAEWRARSGKVGADRPSFRPLAQPADHGADRPGDPSRPRD